MRVAIIGSVLFFAAIILFFVVSSMPLFAQFPLEGTRRAQYAGSWYEADAGKLSAQLSDYLKAASTQVRDGHDSGTNQELLAIIVPHAGYMFSGKTAAFSYEAAQQAHRVKRVFILGPSHHARLHGVALPLAITYETPLGPLSVDKDVVAELKAYPLFSVQPEIQRVEHSLEMQLPFVRQTFGDVKIVPLVVGELADESEVRLVAEVLKGYVTKDDLVIVSSDFTHYGPRYEYSPFGTNFQSSVEKMDKDALAYLSRLDVAGFLKFQNDTHATICGFYPCAVLAAMLPHGTQAKLLKYATSQDTLTDDKDNAVSYLAVTFQGTSWPENPGKRQPVSEAVRLTDADKKALLSIARKSVEQYVNKSISYDVDHSGLSISPELRQCFGAFVTLYKKSDTATAQRKLHEHKELRGCIGSIWPVRPLYQSVVENAIAACSKDYRFHPVSPEELQHLDIEISVLTPPRRVESYREIVLGTDGIIMTKYDRQAVFLPFVPTEFGWDLKETLTQLSLKAGLRPDDWQEGAKYDLFQSISIEEK